MSPQEGDEARSLSLLRQPLFQLRRRLLLVKVVADRLRLGEQILLPHAFAALRAGSFYFVVVTRERGLMAVLVFVAREKENKRPSAAYNTD